MREIEWNGLISTTPARAFLPSFLTPQIYPLDRMDLDFDVILLPDASRLPCKSFARTPSVWIVKLLPEGHFENDIHFQNPPAFSGQKFYSQWPEKRKRENRRPYSPLPATE